MTQLAQIALPKGAMLDIEWNSATQSIVYPYHGYTVSRSDETIGSTLAKHLKLPESELVVEDLCYYEYAGVAVPAPEEMRKGLLGCNWSDYANDNMIFQCRISIREW